MKKLLTFSAVLIALSGYGLSSASLFDENLDAIRAELAQVEYNSAWSQIEPNFIFRDHHKPNCPPLYIPSFLWGFFCGIPGLVLVALICDERKEREHALIGCGINTILFSGFYFLI